MLMWTCVVRYEKLISGMYMGEIARRVIVQCVSLGCLFNGQLTDELNTAHRFYTKYVSEIEKYHAVSSLYLVHICFLCICYKWQQIRGIDRTSFIAGIMACTKLNLL